MGRPFIEKIQNVRVNLRLGEAGQSPGFSFRPSTSDLGDVWPFRKSEGSNSLKVDDKVQVVRAPERLADGKGDTLQTRRIFELCIGRVFPIVGFSNGFIELEVGEVVGQPAYMHSIWIEPDCVSALSPGT